MSAIPLTASADAAALAAARSGAARSVPAMRRAHRVSWPLSWVASAALAVSLLALLPLGFIVWVGLQTGWEPAYTLIVRPRVGELLLNTVLLVLCTVPLCAVLAVALAWLTERSDVPAARTWAWLAVAPLAVPALQDLTLDVLADSLARVELGGRDTVFSRLPDLHRRYVVGVAAASPAALAATALSAAARPS